MPTRRAIPRRSGGEAGSAPRHGGRGAEQALGGGARSGGRLARARPHAQREGGGGHRQRPWPGRRGGGHHERAAYGGPGLRAVGGRITCPPRQPPGSTGGGQRCRGADRTDVSGPDPRDRRGSSQQCRSVPTARAGWRRNRRSRGRRSRAPTGRGARWRTAEATVFLPAESTLLVFTEGLVQTHKRATSEGMAQMVEAAGTAPRRLEELCDHILAACLADVER